MTTSSESSSPIEGHPPLKLRDTLSLIVGIVIGSAIYVVPSSVAANAGSIPWMLGIWLFGGLLSMLGALCYAELASADPRSGGDFNYITDAYGRRFGLAYGWAQLSVIVPGNIAAMSFVFSRHVNNCLEQVGIVGEKSPPAYVISLFAIVALALVNLAGAVLSKHTQNSLTSLKVIGLGLILAAGCIAASPASKPVTQTSAAAEDAADTTADSQEMSRIRELAVALILTMFAYGGWGEAAYVAAEVQDARRNVPRAIIVGIGGIAVLYLLINLAYVRGLTFSGLASTGTPASDLVMLRFGDRAGVGMDVLIAISALGAMQGMIFAGSRLVSSLGEGHGILGPLQKLNSNRSPIWAIVVITGLAGLAVLAFGVDAVRNWLSEAVFRVTGSKLQPSANDALDTLVTALSPVVWLYFMLAGLSVILLRRRHGPRRAPFQTPGYPLTPLVFAATCLWMSIEGVIYSQMMCVVVAIPMLVGLPFVLGGDGTGNRSQSQ